MRPAALTPRGLWVLAALIGIMVGAAASSLDDAIVWWGFLALSPIVLSGLRR